MVTSKTLDGKPLTGPVLREISNRWRRIEAVRQWSKSLPEVLDDSVSVHAAAQKAIAEGLSTSSLGHTMTMIKATREFGQSPDAWLDHQLVGHVLTMRKYRQIVDDYNPSLGDYRELSRLIELNRLLKQAADIIQATADD